MVSINPYSLINITICALGIWLMSYATSFAQDSTLIDYELVISSRRSPPRALYQLSLADNILNPITNNDGLLQQDLDPRWSPNGNHIVFARLFGASGAGTIALLDIETNEIVILTDISEVNARNPIWSATGDYIAYSYFSGNNEEGITIINRNGEVIHRLDSIGVNYRQPIWSPESDILAFISDMDGDMDIYTLDLNSDAISQLTDNTWVDIDPTWSPIGEQIVFTSSPESNGTDIYLLDLSSREQINLTESIEQSLTQPAWSSDNEYIVFRTGVRNEFGATLIYLLHLATGEITIISQDLPILSQPRWSPDSRFILLTVLSRGELYLYDIENETLTYLAEGESADWRIGDNDR